MYVYNYCSEGSFSQEPAYLPRSSFNDKDKTSLALLTNFSNLKVTCTAILRLAAPFSSWLVGAAPSLWFLGQNPTEVALGAPGPSPGPRQCRREREQSKEDNLVLQVFPVFQNPPWSQDPRLPSRQLCGPNTVAAGGNGDPLSGLAFSYSSLTAPPCGQF